MTGTPRPKRNFGPDIGCDLIEWGDRLLPRSLEHPACYAAALVGLVLAGKKIRHSREYFKALTGRPATIFQVWKHYERMIYGLGRKLRAGRGLPPKFVADRPESEFLKMAESGEQALFGTFHIGDSDLLGCMLSHRFGRKLTMVRLRVENSADTDRIGRHFGKLMDFLWVNEPSELLFGIKTAIAEGRSIALQCDREEHASKTALFHFLGARRRFPVTIYHLAALFGKPVAFAFAIPTEDGESTRVFTSTVFRPAPDASRAETLASGEIHFQGVLGTVESLLRDNPYQWFNFIPLNSAEADDTNTRGSTA